MFSKEESRKLRELFWTSFGKSYPRKWILYNTKIKPLNLKFHFDNKSALVAMDIEGDLEKRIELWEKISALKTIIKEEYLPDAIFDESYYLENGKEISRVYVPIDQKVSIHNKDSWREVMIFLNDVMTRFESFFKDYEDYLKA